MGNLNKQEYDFICFLVAGESQRQAYRNAFKKSKRWKNETVDNKASKLFNKDEVQARYIELMKEAKKKASNMAIWSREQAFSEFEWLKNRAKIDINNNGLKQANSKAFVDAINGMNDMAFKDIELTENKLRKELEYLQTKIDSMTSAENSESKIEEYFEKLGDIIDELE